MGVKNDLFRSDIGLGFGRTGRHTPTKNSQSTSRRVSALNFLFYESHDATHPFQCQAFQGKKNNFVTVSFGKREDTGDEGRQKKWDDLYVQCELETNNPSKIRLKRRIKSDELSVQIEQRPFLHLRWIIRLRRIIHLQNPSKLTEKQMDKVRRMSMQN